MLLKNGSSRSKSSRNEYKYEVGSLPDKTFYLSLLQEPGTIQVKFHLAPDYRYTVAVHATFRSFIRSVHDKVECIQLYKLHVVPVFDSSIQ